MSVKRFPVLAAAIAAGFTLYAENIEVPVLYRNADAGQAPYSIQSFGLYENPDRIVLAFQIKDLPKILKQEKASMSFYSDTDNNLDTGRFPKAHGWDFQINIQLFRGTLSAIRWQDSKGEDFKLDGKYAVVPVNDTLFVTIRKEVLPGLKFEKQFKFRANLSTEDQGGTGLPRNVPVDMQNPDGAFPEKFQVPADK